MAPLSNTKRTAVDASHAEMPLLRMFGNGALEQKAGTPQSLFKPLTVTKSSTVFIHLHY